MVFFLAVLSRATLPPHWPEAIVGTNLLPPMSSAFDVWLPNEVVRYEGTFKYLGTNHVFCFDLRRVRMMGFTNIVRTQVQADLRINFDFDFAYEVTIVRFDEDSYPPYPMQVKNAHMQLLALGGATQSVGRIPVRAESLLAEVWLADEDGEPHLFARIRNCVSPVSQGWIDVSPLADGRFRMQSEIWMHTEGQLSMWMTNHVPARTGPWRVALRGEGRDTRVLAVVNEVLETPSLLRPLQRTSLFSQFAGTNLLYGIEFTTNFGRTWQPYVRYDAAGGTLWFQRAELENWTEAIPVRTNRWIRFRSRPAP
ncbi:MAG: hypothetical protein N2652_02720 [Kiritimatiellae bacterium]|nr:hypothetical protein [Kiritimatiellia bacterium]